MSKPTIPMRSYIIDGDVYVRRDDIVRFLTDKAEAIERTEIDPSVPTLMRSTAEVALRNFSATLRRIRDQIETIGTSR